MVGGDGGLPQLPRDAVIEVAALGGAAEVEMTPSEQRDPRIVLRGESVLVSPPPPGSCSTSRASAVPDPLEVEILEGMEELTGEAQQPWIWRVHSSPIRAHESDAYGPKLVSIGPFHHGEDSLLPMEQIKLLYLKNLLSRSVQNNISNYIRVVRDCEPQSRMQYAESFNFYAERFVKMLVLDGCFIIEYLVKRAFKETQGTPQLAGVRWGTTSQATPSSWTTSLTRAGDVAVLKEHGIVESKLGSDEEVAQMFNALTRGTHLKYDEHWNAPLFRGLNSYVEVPQHLWRGSLKQKYFSNPWSIFSQLAAILLLFFTAIQSHYTAFPKK